MKEATLNPAILTYEFDDHDAWWRCSCGTLNVGTASCINCKAEKTLLGPLQDEDLLLQQAKEREYDTAKMKLSENTLPSVKQAIDLFDGLGSYEDSKSLLEQARTVESNLRTKNTRRRNRLAIIGVVAALAIGTGIFVVNVIIPNNRINEAMQLAQEGEFTHAIGILEEYGQDDKVSEVRRMQATSYAEQGKYNEAIAIFASLRDEEAVKQVHEQWAQSYFDKKEYLNAYEQFEDADDLEGMYSCGKALYDEQSYVAAVDVFTDLAEKNYGDAAAMLNESMYAYVKANYVNDNTTTCSYLQQLKAAGYKDSSQLMADLYKVTVTFVKCQNDAAGLYNNGYFTFQFSGLMPDGTDDRTLTFKNGLDGDTHEIRLAGVLKNGQTTVLSSWLKSLGSTVPVTITDNETGQVLFQQNVTV